MGRKEVTGNDVYKLSTPVFASFTSNVNRHSGSVLPQASAHT